MSTTPLERARGAWLGQIAGDALGTTVEFERAASIARRYPRGLREIVGGGPFGLRPGQVTDDTELALALARSLAAAGCYDLEAVAEAYQSWYCSGPFDVGGTTRCAFGGRRANAAAVAARANTRSQSNGSLMRASPLGIIGWALPPDALAELAAADARLSHPHPLCQAAAAIYTHALAHAIREGGTPAEVYSATVAFARGSALCRPALDVLLAAEEGPPAEYHQRMGWVAIALQNAFHQLLRAPDLEEGLVATVMAGGDTDTNACVAGALLGAAHGVEAIPARWREVVLACRSDRGPTYQASDALELADALFAAGAREDGPAPAQAPAPRREAWSLQGADFSPNHSSPYAEELRVSLAAVAEAAGLLRAEALRSGGPRGAGSHADVDDELEEQIVSALARAFPSDTVVAEEGVGRRRGSSGRAWILDPHDGTSDFLRGRHETSISLALIDEGELVLGIVACPNLDLLPQDSAVRALVGDAPSLLVTWAKGDELRRDGRPLQELPPPAGQLAGGDRVLVSAKTSGERLHRNRAAVAPAEVIPCASIATRFALVACGLAEVALTVRNPLAPWDYAGGQALLQGAGGEVVGLEGAPIRWKGIRSPDAYASGYFGARAQALAAEVAARYAAAFFARSRP